MGVVVGGGGAIKDHSPPNFTQSYIGKANSSQLSAPKGTSVNRWPADGVKQSAHTCRSTLPFLAPSHSFLNGTLPFFFVLHKAANSIGIRTGPVVRKRLGVTSSSLSEMESTHLA